ncbi:efflux RND transporter permease subunit [Fulvivirgaceae bacterium BMA10]|uniref:Efflux RND transporter permease subunit n=1 Tax=Splendidivirga corallicola TaxID=3051826 RepID=A0ABT8KPR5_9BACT|nr:efflux RND transporter permease subunit [Fulvivirgaceae bacterium BMA10]
MKITEFSVNRPVTTSMLFLGLVIFGLLAYKRLSVNLMPALDLPAMAITTDHFGATPEEIETGITEEIENELSTLSGLKLLQSYSMANTSLVFVQFNQGTDPNEALNEVKAKLDQVVPYLPKESERPLVQTFDFKDSPVIDLVVLGDGNSSELFDLTDKTIKNRLSRIEGVSKVNLNGGEMREIKILANKKTMYDVQMNLIDLSEYLKRINTKLSAGDFVNQHRQFSLETSNKFTSVQGIREAHIPTPIGVQRLADITKILDTVREVKSKAMFYDVANDRKYSNIISIGVMKNTNANAVQVANEVKELIPELQKELPENVKIIVPFDSSLYVESAVEDALMNVALGILFTGLILFFFLHDIRTTLIVSISVPVSLIGTFIAIRYFNGSLNMMTLMSFSVAIGALISNSIVVIENIVRLRKDGLEIREASIQGTREVMMAVIASTGTNLVVFLPIASMTSITGAFFREYALTISAATVFSLIISFMLTPMLASVLLRKERKISKLSRWMEQFFIWLENKYESSLASLIAAKRNPIILFCVMFVFFLLSTGLLPRIGFEFEPQEDNGDVFLELEMPPGTAITKSAALMKLVEEKVNAHEEVKVMVSDLGSKNSFTVGTNFANAAIKLFPKETRDVSNVEFAEMLTGELMEIPEIIPIVSTSSSEDGAPIQFTLQSTEQEKLLEANELVLQKMNEIEGLLNFESNAREGNPVIQLKPDQRLLAELELSPFEIAATVRAAISGVKATVLKEKGIGYDVRISYQEDQVNTVDKIEELPIFTSSGVFTIGQLVDVSYRTSQAQILHLDKVKTIEFSATPAPGVITGDARDRIETAINQLNLPTGVSFKWAGNIKELDETIDDMTITFAIALLLMYMLLASLLENYWHPVIIFTTVPMAMIGVFVFMFLGGQTMNIMSLMAIVTLLGLVVNDDILIHDYTEQLMHNKKMRLREATLLAGKRKMKTVIMTTVAIIVGMLPNALGFGDAGAEYRTPMAVVTIGGMITSTILTLYLIPSLFYIIREKRMKLE